MHKTYPARLTNGQEYTGNQQFAGFGNSRYCALCCAHRSTGDGAMKRIQGVMQWTCRAHKEPVNA